MATEKIEGKVCTKCRKWKTIENFCHDKYTKNGRHPVCKDCRSKEIRDYRLEHRDEINQGRRERRKNDLDFQRTEREYTFRRYHENKEKLKAKWRARYHNDSEFRERDLLRKKMRHQRPGAKEAQREYDRKRYLDPKIRRRGLKNYRRWSRTVNGRVYTFRKMVRRRERALSIDRQLTTGEVREIYERFHHQCFRCGSREQLAIDHHYPLVKGFALSPQNAVLLCKSCNSEKHGKWPEEFYSLEQLERLNREFGIRKYNPNERG
jgi:hypothetical protein